MARKPTVPAGPTLYNVSTRKAESLPSDQLQQAIASGTHSYEAGQFINVIKSDGEAASVSAEQLKDAIAEGSQIESPMEGEVRKYVADKKGLAGAARVFGEQAVDEFGMGVPGIIAKKFADPLEIAKREGLRKQHELSGIAGSITGFVGSTLYGGSLFKGATKAGQIAARSTEKLVSESLKAAGVRGVSEAAAKGMLARAGQKAIEMGVEGAVVSAPRVITEAMLGDPEQAGETLLLGAGLGAALGVPTGLLGGALGKIASKRAKLAAEESKLAGNAAKADAAVASESKALSGAKEEDLIETIGPIFDANDATQVIRDGVSSKAVGNDLLMAAAERQGVKIPLVMQSDSATMKAIAADTARSPTFSGQSYAKELEKASEGMQDVAARGMGGISAKDALVTESKAVVGDEAAEVLKAEVRKRREGFQQRYKALEDKVENQGISAQAIKDAQEKLFVARKEAVTALESNSGYKLESQASNVSKARLYVNDIAKADSVSSLNISITSIKGEIDQAFRQGDQNLISFLTPIKDAAVKARAAVLDAAGLAGERKALDSGYREFKEWLSDMGQMGKLGKGASASRVIEKLEKIPPEQLVKNLFDVNNSRALTFFQKEFPEAFDKLRQYKLKELAEKHVSAETGKFKVASLLRQVKGLSPEAKGALFSPAQRQSLEDLRILHERFPKMDNPGSAAALERLRFFSNPIAYASQNVADAAKVAALRGEAAYDGLLFLEKTMKKAAEQIDRIPEILDGMAAPAAKGATQSTGFTKSRTGMTDIGPKSIGALLAVLGDDRDPPKDVETAFERLQEKISEPLQQPGKTRKKSGLLAEAISEGGAPLAAESMMMKQVVALTYLEKTMPKALVPSSLVSHRKFKPSDADLSKFARRIEVIMNPFKILDDLGSGTITREQVEALDAVYPKYMSTIRTKVVNALAVNPRNFPYDSRVKLSLLLGMELDPSLTSGAIQSLQSSFAQQPGANAQPEAPQSQDLNLGGVAQMNTGNRAMTDTERVNSRRG